MRYTMRHTIETDVDGFWKLYFDAEFNRMLFEGFLDYLVYQVVEEWTDAEGVTHRRVECTPKVEVPAAVRKLVGDGGYSEIGRYLPGAKYSAEWVPRVGADKFRTSFELWAEPLGDRRCERVMVVENTVKIFGMSALIERVSERSQRGLLAQVADFKNRWIRERGL